MPGVALDPDTKKPLEMVVPSKIRCGSLDPKEMLPEYKCHCHPKDMLGSIGGYWVKVELLNIPWSDELLDLKSERFENAKLFVEEAFDNSILKVDDFRTNTFVRTIAMRFFKGKTAMSQVWNATWISVSNSTNGTSFEELEPGILPGKPFEPLFDLTKPGEMQGFPKEEVYSTFVQMEVQFVRNEEPINIGFFGDVFKQRVLGGNWIDNSLWVRSECFAEKYPVCAVECKLMPYHNNH